MPPPCARSLHLVTPGCVRVCASLDRPFPTLGLHLQAAVLIHRVGGSALGGLSLVWSVQAETSGSIAPTWGVSLGGCCLASTCTVGTIWRFSRPFGAAMIFTAHVKILYLNTFYTGSTMRYIYFTLTPTSQRGGVLYRFSVPCVWDSCFTLMFVLDLQKAWPPFCGDMRYNR